ncbi:MAG: heparinase II/III domain-containing protein [Polyangiaceae bacterium]
MSVGPVLRTVSRITPGQLAARTRFLFLRRLYAARPQLPLDRADRDARGATPRSVLPRLPLSVLVPDGKDAAHARAMRYRRGCFSYLADIHAFAVDEGSQRVLVDWTPAGASRLWRFQLQYLGAALDLVVDGAPDAAAQLIQSWIDRYGTGWDLTAWHTYPVALRLANLCHAAGLAGSFDALGPNAAHLVAVSAAYIHRHLERDVRGNHLLEDVAALLIAARYLEGHPVAAWERTAREIYARELPEQIQPDGSHFELAPMYHAIVLWRLLQIEALLGPRDELVSSTIGPRIVAMRRYLAGILCPDRDVPLLGDSVRACDFAPPAFTLLGDEPVPTGEGVRSFRDAGLHVFRSERLWAIFDAGAVCPEYLPAHGHADTLTVEVWCDGACVVSGPGIYDFTGPERDWGRSSRAHSTLTVDDRNTSEVYDSFRIGGRARIEAVEARSDRVTASAVPWSQDAHLRRTVAFGDTARATLRIEDRAAVRRGTTCRSRLHLHPAVSIVTCADGERQAILGTPRGRVKITSTHPMRREVGRASRQLGRIEPTTLLVQDLRDKPGDSEVEGGWTIVPLEAKGERQ